MEELNRYSRIIDYYQLEGNEERIRHNHEFLISLGRAIYKDIEYKKSNSQERKKLLSKIKGLVKKVKC